jgi:hypothetical protein
MAAKKNNTKRSTKPNSTVRKKATPMKAKRPKKLAKKKSVSKKAAAKKPSRKKPARKSSKRLGRRPYSLNDPQSRSGGQAGDLQSVSNMETADSESVDELLDEGNAFEAGAVLGVEDAENADESEVHTHEVPEDDVPSEYLDES